MTLVFDSDDFKRGESRIGNLEGEGTDEVHGRGRPIASVASASLFVLARHEAGPGDPGVAHAQERGWLLLSCDADIRVAACHFFHTAKTLISHHPLGLPPCIGCMKCMNPESR